MSFFFRKSFSSGPFRFTVSKRGLSSSFGVRGARVTAGPRGTFVTLSSHGMYYRRRIDRPSSRSAPMPLQQQTAEAEPMDSVFHVPTSELAASDQNELVKTLNDNAYTVNPGAILIVASLTSLFLLGSYPSVGVTILLLGACLGIFVSGRFREAHTHEIHYSLDQAASARYRAIQDGVGRLASCSRVWVLNTSAHTSDQKRNAGAGVLITRKPASAGNIPTKGFRSSLPVPSIGANGVVLHFLPDQILMYLRNRYSSIAYGQISLSTRPTRFVETEPVPRDAVRVDTTWRYVNKSGGPDRRFSNNCQIPVLQYAEVTLGTRGGLSLILQTSNLQKAQAFVSGVVGSSANGVSREVASANEQSTPVNENVAKCYELLGLTRPTTAEKAAAAHRSLAALYHPDKYEHLAPEMRSLAKAKMAEINAAYDLIKLDIGMQ